MDARTKKLLDSLTEKLSSEEAVEGWLIERVFLAPDIPSRKWSVMNQMLMYFSGTHDARGFRQWQEVGRTVKKGVKAIYILGPRVVKKQDEQSGEVKEILAGFRHIPVFRYEDTEGEALEYLETPPQMELEALPLIDIAKEMGLKVSTGWTPGAYLGYYRDSTQEIVLCTDEEQVFFHELSHAVDARVHSFSAITKDRSLAEVVAEFSACFLASLYGKRSNLRETRDYIREYSGKDHVAVSLAKAMQRVVEIYEYITQAKVGIAAA